MRSLEENGILMNCKNSEKSISQVANVKGKTCMNNVCQNGRSADLFSSLPDIKPCYEAKLTN